MDRNGSKKESDDSHGRRHRSSSTAFSPSFYPANSFTGIEQQKHQPYSHSNLILEDPASISGDGSSQSTSPYNVHYENIPSRHFPRGLMWPSCCRQPSPRSHGFIKIENNYEYHEDHPYYAHAEEKLTPRGEDTYSRDPEIGMLFPLLREHCASVLSYGLKHTDRKFLMDKYAPWEACEADIWRVGQQSTPCEQQMGACISAFGAALMPIIGKSLEEDKNLRFQYFLDCARLMSDLHYYISTTPGRTYHNGPRTDLLKYREDGIVVDLRRCVEISSGPANVEKRNTLSCTESDLARRSSTSSSSTKNVVEESCERRSKKFDSTSRESSGRKSSSRSGQVSSGHSSRNRRRHRSGSRHSSTWRRR